MEHIKVTNLDNGYIQLVPNKGYRLFNQSANAFFTEAIVKEKQLKDFQAVEI